MLYLGLPSIFMIVAIPMLALYIVYGVAIAITIKLINRNSSQVLVTTKLWMLTLLTLFAWLVSIGIFFVCGFNSHKIESHFTLDSGGTYVVIFLYLQLIAIILIFYFFMLTRITSKSAELTTLARSAWAFGIASVPLSMHATIWIFVRALS